MSEHQVLRTWIRRESGAALEERESLALITGEGVEHDHDRGNKRHVTFVFEDDWNAAAADLGVEVDPVGRRVNILLSGGRGGELIGKRIRVGEATIDIQGETKPCYIMNEAAEGMEDALRPDVRAGVWGTIAEGGLVKPGDTLVVA